MARKLGGVLTDGLLSWPRIEVQGCAQGQHQVWDWEIWTPGGQHCPASKSKALSRTAVRKLLAWCPWLFGVWAHSVTASDSQAGSLRPLSWACSLHHPSNVPVPQALAPAPPSALLGKLLSSGGTGCAHTSGLPPAQSLEPWAHLLPRTLHLGRLRLATPEPTLVHPPPIFPASENGITSHPSS